MPDGRLGGWTAKTKSMEPVMLVAATAFGLIVGLSLGLTGGGGSILAVPLLVYGLGIDLRTAVAMSLVIVGATSLFGAVIQARSGHVLWRAGLVLGSGGIVVAPLGAMAGAALPDDAVVLMFAVLMLIVGAQVIREGRGGEVPSACSGLACTRDERGHPEPTFACTSKLLAAGAATGFLSGLFGVGGGFLLVPALLLVGGVSMQYALATSLVAIAVTSVSGFISNVGAAGSIPIAASLLFAAGSLAGMKAGAALKRRLPSHILRTIFAGAIVIVAGYMVVTTLA